VAVRLDAYRLPIGFGSTQLTTVQLLALHVLSFDPIPFLVVAAVILIQRSHDRHAWLLAVMFGGFIAGVELPQLLPVFSLIWNAFRAGPETRRRTRVMLWGTAGLSCR
jgi:hypothetical protein